MKSTTLMQSPWIPRFWIALAVLCWLLPDSAAQHWGLLAQSWYWLLLALLCQRWQKFGGCGARRPSAHRRRRPSATRRRVRITGLSRGRTAA